jgi:hypothetical protein
MTLTNPGKTDTIRISISYRSVPGKREPAFVGLGELHDPPHNWHGFRILTHNPEVRGLLFFFVNLLFIMQEYVLLCIKKYWKNLPTRFKIASKVIFRKPPNGQWRKWQYSGWERA